MYLTFSSANRLYAKPGVGVDSTSDAKFVVDQSVIAQLGNLSRAGVSKRMTAELCEFCVPNSFSEVNCTLEVQELAGPTASIVLRGYFSFSEFATYLQNRLNASLPGPYTVAYQPAPVAGSNTPSDAYTITSSGAQFRLILTRSNPDSFWLTNPATHLGLIGNSYVNQTTPYANSITSTIPAVLNVVSHLLIQIKPLDSNGQCCDIGPFVQNPAPGGMPPGVGQGMNYAYIVPVDSPKRTYLRFRPNNQYHQKITFQADAVDNWSSWEIEVCRIDGGPVVDLANWTLTLKLSLD